MADSDRIVKLIDQLARPVFIFRMARNSHLKGSVLRQERALAEAERLIAEYKNWEENG